MIFLLICYLFKPLSTVDSYNKTFYNGILIAKETLGILTSSLYYPVLTRLGLFKQETWSAPKKHGHVYIELVVIIGKLHL